MILKTTSTAWFVTVAAMISPRNGVMAISAIPGSLIDPDVTFSHAFSLEVPNALAPSFIYQGTQNGGRKDFIVQIAETAQFCGLYDPAGEELNTTIWSYGQDDLITWPGKTFEVQRGERIRVRWENELPIGPHLLKSLEEVDCIDTNLHWAYSLPCCESLTALDNGVPTVVHLHGGHTDFQFDGNPEFFFSPGFVHLGPRFVNEWYKYDNIQPASTLWYHDHVIGITRLNVYAGMAGFYIIRDDFDTGVWPNDHNLPVYPYETALAIQDRFFKEDGELFYPSHPGDPGYDDFIDAGVVLPPGLFPDGGPTVLTEFFGDHMVVNGVAWPKMSVEPRRYRLRLLNGCDSRFLVVRFETGPEILDFTVIGNDQGLISPITKTSLLMETGSRYDIIVDFTGREGAQIIMTNIGGDEPFKGEIPGPEVFAHTKKIMAFNVELTLSGGVANVPIDFPATGPNPPVLVNQTPSRIRKVALFEGTDEFNRLQPVLGTAEPGDVDWPDDSSECAPSCDEGSCTPGCGFYGTGANDCPLECEGCPYHCAGLDGPMEGSIAWHSPTTENPDLGAIEEWEIWNVSPDAHPIHLHLVHFEVISRHDIIYDEHLPGDGDPTDPDFDPIVDPDTFIPDGDGIYLVPQAVVQHNGAIGAGQKIVFPPAGGCTDEKCYSVLPTNPDGFVDALVDGTRKDMLTALPNQVTKIRAKFDKPGRYVWHCHILSHEDHEMMRVLFVGDGSISRGGGGAQGDPHFKTWHGQHFDYHGECDLILLQSSSFGSGLGLDVHIRTQVRRGMSFISSAVLRIGTDVLEVASQGAYYLNGVAGADLPAEFSGFQFSHTQPADQQHVFDVYLGGRERIKIKTFKDFVSVLIEQGQHENFGDSVGLMGDFEMGQMIARDGETVLDDPNAYGQEWQVLNSEPKLFVTARLPQHPQVCTLPSPMEEIRRLRRRLSESSIDELAAAEACADWGENKDDCIFDVLTTGDIEMAVVGSYN